MILPPGAVWQCLETLFGFHSLGVLQASPEQLPEMFQTTSQSTGWLLNNTPCIPPLPTPPYTQQSFIWPQVSTVLSQGTLIFIWRIIPNLKTILFWPVQYVLNVLSFKNLSSRWQLGFRMSLAGEVKKGDKTMVIPVIFFFFLLLLKVSWTLKSKHLRTAQSRCGLKNTVC